MSKWTSEHSFFRASIILFLVSPDPHGLGGPLLVAAPLNSLGGPLDLDPFSAWMSSLGVALETSCAKRQEVLAFWSFWTRSEWCWWLLGEAFAWGQSLQSLSELLSLSYATQRKPLCGPEYCWSWWICPLPFYLAWCGGMVWQHCGSGSSSMSHCSFLAERQPSKWFGFFFPVSAWHFVSKNILKWVFSLY